MRAVGYRHLQQRATLGMFSEYSAYRMVFGVSYAFKAEAQLCKLGNADEANLTISRTQGGVRLDEVRSKTVQAIISALRSQTAASMKICPVSNITMVCNFACRVISSSGMVLLVPRISRWKTREKVKHRTRIKGNPALSIQQSFTPFFRLH